MNQTSETDHLWQEVDKELIAARAARSAGNEGKARVCARRAAGKALQTSGLSSGPPLAAIGLFLDSHQLPYEVQEACSHLLLPVNEQYRLADGIDLISDTEKIVSYVRSSLPSEGA